MGSIRRSVMAVSLAVLIAVSACTGGGPVAQRHQGGLPSGGTLRIGLVSNGSSDCPFLLCGSSFDPIENQFISATELARCCLERTLLSYNGRSAADHGTTLEPDLASALPTVSSDGLTWAFHLRSGIHYAPPLAKTEVVAQDFVRSIERTLTPVHWDIGNLGGYLASQYLPDAIAGARDFLDGKASTISGLETPDPHTLVVHLTQPTGDLGYRLAWGALGPIPENPARPGDPLGIAQGHDRDFGDFLVSTGPYMFAGSAQLDFSKPPEDQISPPGDGSETATLVRNPSWSAAQDPLRPAYADRIIFYRLQSDQQAERMVRDGTVDLVPNWNPDEQTLERWRADPSLRDRIFLAPTDAGRYLTLNLAVPPFDDLHVRKAVNYALDRNALVAIFEKYGTPGEPLMHIGLDSYEDDLLIGYRPVATAGDIAAAHREMALSPYDRNGDGRCDGAVCRSIPLLAEMGQPPGQVQIARAIAAQLRGIGLYVDVKPLPQGAAPFGDPSAHVVLRFGGWLKDLPSASTFFPVLFESGSPLNDSMVGASPAELRRYHYKVTQEPNVDGRISACLQLLFEAQVRCWAGLDQYLMEQVVPWVPILQELRAWAVGPRVRGFTVDSSIPIPQPSLDEISLAPGPTTAAPAIAEPSSVSDIPNGVYRTTVTAADVARFGTTGFHVLGSPAGTVTITLQDGRFEIRSPLTSDVLVGTYGGSGGNVNFGVEAPSWARSTFGGSMSWRLDGDGLRFSSVPCVSPPSDPIDCSVSRAIFEGHPWKRIA